MLFNSFPFLFFFIIIIILFFTLPQKLKNLFLLFASYYFYFCGGAEYLFLLIVFTLYNYYAAIYLDKAKNRTARKLLFITTVVLDVCPLFLFKYFNFFSSSLQSVFSELNILYNLPLLSIALPLGISFYTFITIGYLIDVYWKARVPETNLINFSLYVTFFPQILSGPIARSTSLIPQLYRDHPFTHKNASDGLRLMLWGFFQKFVIADNIAPYVDTIYNNISLHNGSSMLLASYLFAFQLYCDFAGYSNLAIGSARILGFELMENFRKPYFATSVTEYWKRNHISLTTWLRDYIFYPLMGSSFTPAKISVNIIIMFLISGLWHGANWTFIIWGLIQGVYLVYDLLTSKWNKKITKYFKQHGLLRVKKGLDVLITFNLIVLGLIFFRANSVSDAFLILQNIFSFNWQELFWGDDPSLFYGLCGIVVLLIIETLQKELTFIEFITRRGLAVRWAFYCFCITTILLIGALNGKSFIYFQF
jgi:D-alanyl-lipoteichoic acid acyltransferase DltB (MBOAT superfamily)